MSSRTGRCKCVPRSAPVIKMKPAGLFSSARKIRRWPFRTGPSLLHFRSIGSNGNCWWNAWAILRGNANILLYRYLWIKDTSSVHIWCATRVCHFRIFPFQRTGCHGRVDNFKRTCMEKELCSIDFVSHFRWVNFYLQLVARKQGSVYRRHAKSPYRVSCFYICRRLYQAIARQR